jgi:hypothetical protein
LNAAGRVLSIGCLAKPRIAGAGIEPRILAGTIEGIEELYPKERF